MRSSRQCSWALLALCLVLIYCTKRYYSAASADDLEFVLRPTAALVECFTGTAFSREQGAGFVSRDQLFVIAPACAGLNFSLVLLLTVTLGLVPRCRTDRAKLTLFALTIPPAYALTILVNAIRISLALAMRSGDSIWSTPGQAHRILGVLVYFGALCLMFLLARRWIGAECSASTLDEAR